MTSREIRDLCDPSRHSSEDARQIAKTCATHDKAFHLEILGLIREQSAASRPDLAMIGRALDLIDAAAPASSLNSLLQPILRNCDPQIQSKCVLMAARHDANLVWVEKLLHHDDARVRASVIEGLWDNKSEEALSIFRRASKDPHHRVVANAAYGLQRSGATEFDQVILQMEKNRDPLFRRAAAWVIRKIASPDLRPLLKPLVLDPVPAVRQAAFRTLAALGTRDT